MVRELMRVPVISMQQIDDVFMGMTMMLDLSMMNGKELCQLNRVMGNVAHIRRRDDASHQ